MRAPVGLRLRAPLVAVLVCLAGSVSAEDAPRAPPKSAPAPAPTPPSPPATAAPTAPDAKPVRESSRPARDESTVAPDPKESADNNVSFPTDI